jgi:hypothetical protein
MALPQAHEVDGKLIELRRGKNAELRHVVAGLDVLAGDDEAHHAAARRWVREKIREVTGLTRSLRGRQ